MTIETGPLTLDTVPCPWQCFPGSKRPDSSSPSRPPSDPAEHGAFNGSSPPLPTTVTDNISDGRTHSQKLRKIPHHNSSFVLNPPREHMTLLMTSEGQINRRQGRQNSPNYSNAFSVLSRRWTIGTVVSEDAVSPLDIIRPSIFRQSATQGYVKPMPGWELMNRRNFEVFFKTGLRDRALRKSMR